MTNLNSTRGLNTLLVCGVLLATASAAMAQTGDWVPVTGEETLRDFMSGLHVERELPGKAMSQGEYNTDGTGVLHSWGARFPRTWTVKNDDQLCVTEERVTQCYRIEESTLEPGLFRARNVSSDQLTEFRLVENEAIAVGKPKEVGSKGGPAAASAAEIAAELSNPNTAMGTLNTNFDFIAFDGDLPGAGDESALKMVFQPSLPYPLGGGTNFFVRPAIPIIFDQSVPNLDGGFDSKGLDLGDIGFDASFGFSFKNGTNTNVVIAGMAGTIPTATDDSLGLDQWLLGPELGGFLVRKWGVVGIIASHQWDIAGEDSFSTSTTGGQYIYVLNLKDGWQITGSPAWSYNHKAESGNAWTFPLAAGIAKTVFWAGRPWKLSAQYWHYIESPAAFGPKNQVRVTIGPVVSLPWKGRQ